MAFQHGKNAYLSVDATDVSSYTDQQSLSRNVDPSETTSFGNDDKTFIAGLREHDISSGGKWDPTGDGVFDGADDGATVAVVFGPEGNDGGDVQYTSNAFLTNYTIDVGVANAATYSSTFKPSGTVTRGTV